jgi:TPR repeat protein
MGRLEKMCDEERDGWTCFELAQGYLQGSVGMPRDVERGLNYLKKACELDNQKACLLQEKIAEKLNDDLTGKVKLMLDKLSEATQACLQGSDVEICTTVLSALQQGCKAKLQQMCPLIVPVARRSCDLGSENLCVQYASAAKDSCESGDACGCGELGRLMVYPRPPVRPNRKTGIELLRAGCRKDCSDSCKILKELGVSP